MPDERADIFYHYYDGGGVTVHGPALQARKNIGDNASFSARYYVDMISSASIDVVTTASPYKDERTEYAAGLDYLHGNSLVSLYYTTSKESDYLSDGYSVNVAHDLFGGLTTVSLGYGHSQDTVMRVDTSFRDSVDRHNFRLGVNQILTRRLMLSLSFEDVSEDGFLNNPYRSVYIGTSFPAATHSEVYPRTRDSQAFAIRGVMGFGSDIRPLLRSVRAEYRYYRDTWDVQANTLALAVQRYFGDRWIGEFRYRYYQQSAASFYRDLFATEYNYMARDKELSTFASQSIGAKATWTFVNLSWLRGSLTWSYDYLRFEYDDFTDVRTGQLYSFNANVAQFLVSLWY